MTRVCGRRAMVLENWPDRDRLGWQEMMLALNSSFSDKWRPSWNSSTANAVAGSYGRWLTWLHENHPGELLELAAVRLRLELIEPYVQDLQNNLCNVSIGTALIHVQGVTQILFPCFRADWLRPLIARLRRNPQSSRRKSERLVPSRHLLEFGLELMELVRVRSPMGNHARLLQYRDGLAIALLSVRPLRLANFLGIKIGVHLVIRNDKKWLCFSRDETKNKIDLEFPFPEALLDYLAYYLATVRPQLAANGKMQNMLATNHLWLSQNGTPLGRQTLHAMLERRTTARFGKAVNPHLFRDCLATSIASENADLAWTIPHILGHRSSATSEASYVHTSGAPELLMFQRHVAKLRAQSLGNRDKKPDRHSQFVKR